jgi:predicted peptidase
MARLMAGLLLGAIVIGDGGVAAQGVPTGFLDRTVTVDGAQHRYQVYVPRDYTASQDWPVVLFLHGAGERGDDGLIQTQVGLPAAVRFNVERWPAIMLMPQVAEDATWVGKFGDVALAALDATESEYRTDVDRTYLTGLSMGGAGAWYLGSRHAERFAALVAVCGYVTGTARHPGPFVDSEEPFSELAEAVAGLPIWIFHGGADQVIPVAESQGIAAALEAIGADVTYTEFEGVNHNSWDSAYSTDGLAPWLFSQKRERSRQD